MATLSALRIFTMAFFLVAVVSLLFGQPETKTALVIVFTALGIITGTATILSKRGYK